MKNILSLLYQGKISPIEQYALKSEEYLKVHQAHLHHYDDFVEALANLNPPLDKRFMEIMEEQSALIPYEFSEIKSAYSLSLRIDYSVEMYCCIAVWAVFKIILPCHNVIPIYLLIPCAVFPDKYGEKDALRVIGLISNAKQGVFDICHSSG